MAAYAYWEYPQGSLRSVGRDEYREVFGAERLAKWQSDRGRVAFLELAFASHMHGFSDTAMMHHEATLLFPLAESLAARTGDTVIQLDHRWFPLSRMVPLRVDAWTFFHRMHTGEWTSSNSLWH